MYELLYANDFSLEYISNHDNHISREILERKIRDMEVLVVKKSEKIVGWMRYSLFWDNIPFMNMLMIEEEYRGRGLGRLLVEYWEKEMKAKAYKYVMISTLSNESAQHFYRRLDYRDIGCLLLEDEGLEIVFKKEI